MKEKIKDCLMLVPASGGCLAVILILGVPVIVGIKLLMLLAEWLF